MFYRRRALVAVLAACLAPLAFGGTLANADEGCRFKGPVLFCLDGDASLEAIVARFGSDATRRTIETETLNLSRFERRPERERYRVSIERNNTRAVRFVKHADRELRAGRISADEYRRRLAVYREAYETYKRAIARYEEANWFDPVADAPEGRDRTDDTLAVKG